VSRADVVAGVEQTAEYRGRSRVQDLYQELLHRTAEPGGLQYYSDLLAAAKPWSRWRR